MIKRSFHSAIVSRVVSRVVRTAGLALVAAAAALSAPAAPSSATPEAQLLERVGERVTQFWEHLSSVACTENVLQEKLDPKGKVTLNNKASYDYLISLHWDNEGMLVDESRLAIGPPQKKAPQGVLLTTHGFAALLMTFHPRFQASYSFSSLGEEEVAGRKVTRIGFLARNGAPTPSVLSLKGREYPIAWEGTAWIDSELAVVTRIQARWKDPAPELGLKSLSSEVRYTPVAFRGKAESFWLPDTAKVEAETQHQHWRNTHHFSNARLFNVDTTDSVSGETAANVSSTKSKKDDQR
jgi:hypothetical protein